MNLKKFVNSYDFKRPKIETLVVGMCFALFVYGLLFSLFVRAPARDETSYLLETQLIYQLLKNGEWIGNYGVGLHGFIFKLIPALFYFVTGPSIFLATMFNVFIASLCCWLFYKFVNAHFFSGYWSLGATLMLVLSQRFLLITPTFLREMPALLVFLLLSLAIFNKRSRLIISLLFILLLDAKEYVFFAFSVSYAVYIIYITVFFKTGKFFDRCFLILKELSGVFWASALYLVLMFCTSIVPVNMFTSFILGVNKEKTLIEYILTYITRDTSLLNVSKTDLSNSFFGILNGSSVGFSALNNAFENYYNKIVNSESFALLSLPFVILVPGLYYMATNFRKYKDSPVVALIIFHIIYLLVVLSQFNQNRYLFPLYPTSFTFFLLFLKSSNIKRLHLNILVVCIVLLTLPQLFLTTSFVEIKILINALLIMLFIGSITLPDKVKNIAISIFVGFYCFISIGIAYTYFMAGGPGVYGQLFLSKSYGRNLSYDKIATLINNDDVVVTNLNLTADLLSLYRNDNFITPEWQWTLQSWLPKKQMLQTLSSQKTYYAEDSASFCKFISNPKLDRAVVIVLRENKEDSELNYACVLNNYKTVSYEGKNLRVYISDLTSD